MHASEWLDFDCLDVARLAVLRLVLSGQAAKADEARRMGSDFGQKWLPFEEDVSVRAVDVAWREVVSEELQRLGACVEFVPLRFKVLSGVF